MYTGFQLLERLEQQYQARGQSGLFKRGKFKILWRAKVGSFPHPDLETMVSAGEPCGSWETNQQQPRDKDRLGQYFRELPKLPLNGYIPGSSIRGIVRAWAKQRPEIFPTMQRLLGYQKGGTMHSGKIQFLDAWPVKPTRLTLDIVNPQQEFQVEHRGSASPLPLYTLGDGKNPIEVEVAICGIRNIDEEEVTEVWDWVQQALSLYGVGNRTVSGYGSMEIPGLSRPNSDPGYSVKEFEFNLYTQGCAGPKTSEMELRPSHWRGWLRSWVLRFFLGVMSIEDAKTTVNQLFGIVGTKSHRGCVRLQMNQGDVWGRRSQNSPNFYAWKGSLTLTAPDDILEPILIPIMQFAVMVGGVGRGWRRPLHIFRLNGDGKATARGTYVTLQEKVETDGGVGRFRSFGLSLRQERWIEVYENWKSAVEHQWFDRVVQGNLTPEAEVFSPTACAVYEVPGCEKEPLDRNNNCWDVTDGLKTRGEGMGLIYETRYKYQPEVGGKVRGGASCSWVSIKRVNQWKNLANKEEGIIPKEIVCIFMGGKTPQLNHLRAQFLRDLALIRDAEYLFGVRPPK